MVSSGSTLRPRPPRREDAACAAWLFLALRADKPLSGGVRYSLAGLDEVAIGRCPERGAATRLEIEVADGLMSREHARLRRTPSGWLVEDQDSRNGSRVNGQPLERQALADGDVLALGSTLFVFRSSMAEAARTIPEPAPAALDTLLPSLQARFAQLAQVAPTALEVVIHGESGTGKELAARALHALSGRRGQFVAVNCGSLSPALVESELFGHRKGAFTGALDDRPGLLRSADRGTLLLDEIGDLPLPAQAALLRVLQEREVLPVGAERPLPIDVRVVSATHHDLKSLAAQGRFRADLLARLSGFTLTLLPLRERREDLGLLIAHLLKRLAPRRAAQCRFEAEAALALFLHGWPLNIRELEKGLSLALALSGDGPIELAHLPESIRSALRRAPPSPIGAAVSAPPPSLIAPSASVVAPSVAAPRRAGLRPDAPLSPAEQKHREELIALLQQHQGSVAHVARALGKQRMQIHRWLKRYRLAISSFRP
jgi:DNA-binding NtrC family response regulator